MQPSSSLAHHAVHRKHGSLPSSLLSVPRCELQTLRGCHPLLLTRSSAALLLPGGSQLHVCVPHPGVCANLPQNVVREDLADGTIPGSLLGSVFPILAQTLCLNSHIALSILYGSLANLWVPNLSFTVAPAVPVGVYMGVKYRDIDISKMYVRVDLD